MTGSSSQTIRSRGSRAPARRHLPLVVALLAVLLGPAISAPAMVGNAAEAGRLRSDLARMAKLAKRGLQPQARRLAQRLPTEAERLGRLREPASTATAQIRVTLDELRQMSALRLDPHYLPALVAAGRAFLAASGQDPLTGTAVNPDYSGLEAELAASEAGLGGYATEAAKLSARVKRLARALARSERRATRLESRIDRLRATRARPEDGAR